MTWQEVLEQDIWVGGDLESHETFSVFRGRIERLETRGNTLIWHFSWLAKRRHNDESWQKIKPKPFSVNMNALRPQEQEGGGFGYATSFGTTYIIPKFGPILDETKVVVPDVN